MRTVYVMVGLPGSGKSTKAQRLAEEMAHGDQLPLVVLSSDAFIQHRADVAGISYNEAFEANIKAADANYWTNVSYYAASNSSFICDRTHVHVRSRTRLISAIRQHSNCPTRIIAVCVDPSDEELDRRRKARVEKQISGTVLAIMKMNYVSPTFEEGFDEIWHVR